jgi:hypothetical protein
MGKVDPRSDPDFAALDPALKARLRAVIEGRDPTETSAQMLASLERLRDQAALESEAQGQGEPTTDEGPIPTDEELAELEATYEAANSAVKAAAEAAGRAKEEYERIWAIYWSARTAYRDARRKVSGDPTEEELQAQQELLDGIFDGIARRAAE